MHSCFDTFFVLVQIISRFVLATATSKAVIDEPGGESRVSLIAAATAEAISTDPYAALARATADAASRVSRVVARAAGGADGGGGDELVSLVVSSSIRASSRDLLALANASRSDVTRSIATAEQGNSVDKG